jgi:uncharacterized protein (DUF1810 family)
MDASSQLARFVTAQDAVWPQVVAELGAGTKRTHWMWFVFPQLRELGRSETARRYGIPSAAEARDYLAHPRSGRGSSSARGSCWRSTGAARTRSSDRPTTSSSARA